MHSGNQPDVMLGRLSICDFFLRYIRDGSLSICDYWSIFHHLPTLAEAFKANCEAQSPPIPEYLTEFTSIFSKKSFDILPEPKQWDHAVRIIPGSKASNCKVYLLSLPEQKELDAFLKENLETGRIQPSKSLMASLVFFIKKKDGSL